MMPAASSIVLNDGTNDKTYVPVSVQPQKTTLADRSSVISAGNSKAVLGLRPATPQRATNRVEIGFSKPIEDTVDGVTTVRSIPRVNTDVVLPDDMTTAERTAFWTQYQALVANADVSGFVKDLEPLW